MGLVQPARKSIKHLAFIRHLLGVPPGAKENVKTPFLHEDQARVLRLPPEASAHFT